MPDFRAARVLPLIRRCVETILLLACLLFSTAASASELTEYEIRIERKSLPKALAALASQTNTSVFTVEERLSEIMVGPIYGTMSVEEALHRLLEGTSFIFIRSAGGYELRLAPVIRAPRMPAPAAGRLDDDRASERATMMVLGARIMRTPTLPESVILDSRAIDRAGVSTVGELLTYLSQQPHALPESMWGDGAQYADLRGLGPDMTTVLINGRWVPSSAPSGVAFDLNTLPLAAVEQVEVITDASAAPGGHRAVGDVLNIRLKRAAPSPTARIEYGTAVGGSAQRQAVFSAGTNGSKLTSSVVGEYFERGELPGAAREFWRDQDFSRFGGSDYRSPASWPGNISSTTGAPLPGLSSSYAAVPLGTADANPEISDFQATAGTYRLDSLRRFSSILPAARRLSVVGNAEYSFEKVSAFAELLGVDRSTEYQFAPPTLTDVLVPATNAFNPFGEGVYVSRLLHEIGPRRVVTDSQLLRIVAGMRGALNAWDWEVTALNSEESASRWANNVLDEERVASALASSDPNQALNVFQDGPVGSPELMASLVAPNAVELRSRGSELAANLRGPLIALPTGDVTALLGAHWRREITSSTRTVSSGHAELSVPLLPQQLAAKMSMRFDHFSDIEPTLTNHFALTWQPFESLQVRWSHGRGFRVPATYELSGPRYPVQTLVADRRRDGEVRTITAVVGSSSQLQSVYGESTAVSVSMIPSNLHGLEMGASYWVKRINRRIAPVPLTLILENEAAFAHRVIRDQPTPDDIAAGRPGALSVVDLSLFNVGGLEASGIDATVSYRFNREWDAQVSATWMDRFASADIPGAPMTDRIGVAHPSGTIPRWRATAAVYWNNPLAGVSLIARYVAPSEAGVGNQRTGRRLSAQTSIDMQASLELGNLAPSAALLRDVSLTAGVLNLFDTPPQFSPVGQDLGYDPSLSDPRQRFGYLRIQKQF